MTDLLKLKDYKAKYELWLKSELKTRIEAMRDKNLLGNAQTVVYSGPSNQHSDLHKFTNRGRADAYAKREGSITLETTARGEYLEQNNEAITLELTKLVGPKGAMNFIALEWTGISNDYALHAKGHVRAFVVGARPGRVFRKTELPALVSSHRVLSINGISRVELEKSIPQHLSAKERQDNRHYDAIYHRVAAAGIRIDMRRALRTGDEILLGDALVQRHLHQDQQRLEKGGEPLSSATQQTRLAEIKERAKRLAAISQNRVRLQALQNMRDYTGHQVGSGQLTQEYAERLMRYSGRSMQDPKKAFRVKELARLNLMAAKLQAAPSSNNHDIHSFMNAKLGYEADVRAVQQANGLPFVDAEAKSLISNQSRRAMIERNNTKRAHQDSPPSIQLQLLNDLDESLASQRIQDELALGLRKRTKIVRAEPMRHGFH